MERSCKEAVRMKHKFLLYFICITAAACLLICCACGQAYELVLTDSPSESRSGAGEQKTAEYADQTPDSGADYTDSEKSGKETAETDGEPDAAGSISGASGAEQEKQICVYVCGAVRDTGVYTLPAGSRVYEAVEAAGGLTEDAEPRALNQAQLLEDGQQITVLTRDETENTGTGIPVINETDSGGAAGGPDIKTEIVNLNTADKEALMSLSGIGEARAEAILAYRQEHGMFSSAEEIMQIDGIGEKLYRKLKDRITA